MSHGDEREERQPLLRVVRGHPTPEELAALVAVTAAHRAAAGVARPPRRSAWSDRTRLLRTPLRPAPGAWWAWALPR